MKTAFAVMIVLAITACASTHDEGRAEHALDLEGVQSARLEAENINVFSGCWYATRFYGTKDGVPVSGVVCSKSNHLTQILYDN